VELIAACFDTHDQPEGMDAFLEGRDPAFRGE
jgi:enoyl-CoA hydratase/carnithine racemase